MTDGQILLTAVVLVPIGYLLLGLTLRGCAARDEQNCKLLAARYDNVQTVTVRKHGHYALEYSPDSSGRLESIYVGEGERVMDVPDGQPMWAERKGIYSDFSCRVFTTIHVHSARDVSGGWYSYGKGQHGYSVVTDAE